MAKVKQAGPVVLTANHLLSGRAVFWTGEVWAENFNAALTIPEDGADRDALAEHGRREEANNIVVGAYLVELDEAGEPVLMREGRRTLGPSIDIPDQPLSQIAA
ncbi:MAG: DUF2849 domain-containing protein [Pseudomonadota bacterium]